MERVVCVLAGFYACLEQDRCCRSWKLNEKERVGRSAGCSGLFRLASADS